MSIRNLQGKFIEVDGPDGSGKETQAERLREHMQNLGLTVPKWSFPRYEHPAAQLVVSYLRKGLFGPATQVDPRLASVFFAIDRMHASSQIRSDLTSGGTVVADRFVAANMGHQGGKINDESERTAYFRWVLELEYVHLGIPRPDLTIILWAAPEILLPRLEAKKVDRQPGQKDGHEDSAEHIAAAVRTYKEIAQVASSFDLLVQFVDCGDDSKDQVTERVWAVIEDRFHVGTLA